jgi:hypothetical protein
MNHLFLTNLRTHSRTYIRKYSKTYIYNLYYYTILSYLTNYSTKNKIYIHYSININCDQHMKYLFLTNLRTHSRTHIRTYSKLYTGYPYHYINDSSKNNNNYYSNSQIIIRNLSGIFFRLV